ncbi:MAG: transcriptional regulator, IclR family [Firmicutes bacterium]|nr:transcriptional regulator, IclR family [Bacillota bacterium]
MERIKSVDRAIDLLECFTETKTEIGVTELAKLIGITKPSAYRMAETLLTRGYLIKDPDRLRYQIGPKVLGLLKVFFSKLDIRTIALPHMNKIRDIFDEGVSLFMVIGDKRVCVESVESTQPLRRVMFIGEALPLGVGASGKLLVAYQGFESYQGVNKNELDQIREQGYSVSHDERGNHISAVAVPIRNHLGQVIGALTMAGSSSRYSEEFVSRYIPVMQHHGDNISRELGFLKKS